MAGQVNFYWWMKYLGAGPGPQPSLGDIENPVVIPCATDLNYRKDFSIAASGTATLFDTDDSGLADFDFILIVSDVSDVMVEFVTDQNAGVGTVVSTKELFAGLPFVLGSNDSYANYTINFAAGTLDVIDLIRAKNLGSDTARVTCFAAT